MPSQYWRCSINTVNTHHICHLRHQHHLALAHLTLLDSFGLNSPGPFKSVLPIFTTRCCRRCRRLQSVTSATLAIYPSLFQHFWTGLELFSFTFKFCRYFFQPQEHILTSHPTNSILGTNPVDIDKAEDRQKFSEILDSIGVDQPAWKELTSVADAEAFADEVSYPVLVRPSYGTLSFPYCPFKTSS